VSEFVRIFDACDVFQEITPSIVIDHLIVPYYIELMELYVDKVVYVGESLEHLLLKYHVYDPLRLASTLCLGSFHERLLMLIALVEPRLLN
jgi:hypothetical protein